LNARSVTADLPEPLASAPLLLVSPHFDDAALSCAALVGRQQPVDVLTVFAGEPNPPRQGGWDRATGFADSAVSMPTRREEERAAFAATPHRLHLLDLLEGQHLAGRRPAADGDSIVEAVMRWNGHTRGGVVALPAGAGLTPGRVRGRMRRIAGATLRPTQHPDHLFTRDAVLGVLAPLADVQIALYEEHPYSWVKGADDVVGRLARRHGLTGECIVVPVDRDVKAARIGIYTTQVPHLGVDSRRVDRAQDPPGEERYWLLHRRQGRSAPRG
jgi:GlcNAc-PI de-N-acetylase